MTETHSKLGASSMYRWAACPGSVRLCAGIPSYSSSYAQEGTDAHALAKDVLDAKIALESIKDEETREAVATYVEFVRNRIKPGITKVMLEHRFDLESVHPGCFGIADAVIYDPTAKLLTVVDYKHGAGIAVEAENNPQLNYYALGALLTSGHPAEKVCKAIIQPRCDHRDGPIRTQTIDAIDLLDFRADLKDYAQATEKPDAPLVVGSHCRFCPAAAVCPALSSNAIEAAKSVFSAPAGYDPEKLKAALDARPAVEAWVKALDEFAYREAEAGRTPIGYKLVDKCPRRKWRAEGEVIMALQALDVADDVIFAPREVKSPAQLEKLKVDKALVAQFTVSKSSGHALVPVSDSRPAVSAGPAAVFLPA